MKALKQIGVSALVAASIVGSLFCAAQAHACEPWEQGCYIVNPGPVMPTWWAGPSWAYGSYYGPGWYYGHYWPGGPWYGYW